MVHLVVKMSCGGDITAPGDHTACCRAARMGNVWLIVVSMQPVLRQNITFLHPLIKISFQVYLQFSYASDTSAPLRCNVSSVV